MRNYGLFLAFLGCLVFSLLVSTAFADDGEFGDADNPYEFSDFEETGELDFTHYDQDPFKGWATVWFLNVCGGQWGDFHMKLIGKDLANVDFVVDGEFAPKIYLYTAGVGSQIITDMTFNVSEDGDQLDMYFYDEPINNYSIGYVKVYTDNNSECDWFTIKAYPTAVPEPVTISLLGFGAAVLLRRRRVR